MVPGIKNQSNYRLLNMTEYMEYTYTSLLSCGQFVCNNLYGTIHECLSQYKYNGITKMSNSRPTINILLKTNSLLESVKCYDIVVDSFEVTNNLLLVSKTNKLTFDLKLNDCISNIYKYFGLCCETQFTRLYEHSIRGLVNDITGKTSEQEVLVKSEYVKHLPAQKPSQLQAFSVHENARSLRQIF